MTARITQRKAGGTSFWAEQVLGYRAERKSRNRIHDVVGGGVAVQLGAANPRSGHLDVLILHEQSALDAFNLLSLGEVYTFESFDRPALNMTFSVDENSVSIELDPTTREYWIVGFGFQEL
ncbi:hypothetical protein [Microbacterium sp. XT11]|uniref:hypothetical protein n=1 Tax=Microbacterium sp. XT11 TaxID=367477 RepID=UPI000833A4F6|nr:hypothetical protein [Microbacterium sp. XT11]